MTVEEYKARMKAAGIEREGLEGKILPFAQAHPRQWRESAYMPGQTKQERAQKHREKLAKQRVP